MNGKMTIIQAFEDSNLLLKGINKTWGFLGILLEPLKLVH